MARKGNPISVRLGINRSSDSTWFSDYYYPKFVYQDVNLRSYFPSIRPPTKLTFGFRLGSAILLHFPKRTFIQFFLPRRPLRLKRQTGKSTEKGRWWTTFGRAAPIGCLHDHTEKERKEVRGQSSRVLKRVQSIRLSEAHPKKESSVLGWPKQRYRYQSPSIKKNLSKSLPISGAFKHPKYAGNDIANDHSFRKTKFFQFFFKSAHRYDGQHTAALNSLRTQHIPAVRPSFHYLVMQYFWNTKNQFHFHPVLVLHHFVPPVQSKAVDELPSIARAQGRSLQKRIRSRIAFFVESSTSEKKDQAFKRLTHFIRFTAFNHQSFEGTTNISLFPFFGPTFIRDAAGKNLDAREQLLNQLRIKCWNLMGNQKVIQLIEKLQAPSPAQRKASIEEFIKVIDILIEIILRKRGIPYRYNSYLYEVQKMRSFLSNRTKTKTVIEAVKIKSLYQSAYPIAQDISFQLKNKRRSFHSIFATIVKQIPKGVEGIRICFSGRLKDAADKAQTKCYKHRKTSRNVFNQKIDYAPAQIATRYGISGVKVWISYSHKRGPRAISQTYQI